MKRLTLKEMLENKVKLNEVIKTVKGTKAIEDTIKEAIKLDIPICVYGKECTGKTMILRAVLDIVPLFNSSENGDNLDIGEIEKEVLKGNIKYFTVHEAVIEQLKEKYSDRGLRKNIVLIKCKQDSNGVKYIENVTELITVDGKTDEIELVNIVKQKYNKISKVEAL